MLAISGDGEDMFVLDVVRSAKSNGVKIYAMCSDVQSSLSILADEILIMDGSDFNEGAKNIWDSVIRQITEIFENEELQMKQSHAIGSTISSCSLIQQNLPLNFQNGF